MKKWLMLLIFLLGCFSFSSIANNIAFEEGKHYIKLDRPHENNSVVKIYSVYCPYCFKYEKSVTPELIKSLPPGTKFESWSLSTKGKYGEQANQILSVLTLHTSPEIISKVKLAYYKAIHTDKKEFKSELAFIDFGLRVSGMSIQDFDKYVNEPEEVKLRQYWDQAIEIAKIQGVPAFVVNGQYLIKTDSIVSLPMFNQLVSFLLTQ